MGILETTSEVNAKAAATRALPRALVFDVDGTLADTEAAHRASFNQTFAHFGIGWHWSAADYTRLLKVTGGKERMAAHLDTLALPAAEATALRRLIPHWHADKTTRFAELVAGGALALRPGVAQLMSEAQTAGVLLGIATTTTRANVDALLAAHFGAAAATVFDVIACGDEVPHKKPAPDVYELALRLLAVDAADAVAFEDSAAGLQSAVAAGLWTVVTPTEWTAGSNFDAAGLVCADLTQCTADGSILNGVAAQWRSATAAHQNRGSQARRCAAIP